MSEVEKSTSAPTDLQHYVNDLLVEDAEFVNKSVAASSRSITKNHNKPLNSVSQFDEPPIAKKASVLFSPTLLQVPDKQTVNDSEKTSDSQQKDRAKDRGTADASTVSKPVLSDDLIKKAGTGRAKNTDSDSDSAVVSQNPQRNKSTQSNIRQTVTGDWDAGILSSRLNKEHQSSQPTAALVDSLEWLENGKPAWAQQRFDCLFFEVGNVAIAMPLVTLGSVHYITSDMRNIVGSNELTLGVMPINGANYKVVDTGKLVASSQEGSTDKGERGYKYIISINATDFGLAVSEIKRSAPIDPNAVKWRTNRSSRRWLAGIVKEQMCVILDAAELKRLFC